MWSAIIPAGDNMLGRAHDFAMSDQQRRWSNRAADVQFARQKELQQMQQNWQEQMSNTAYQRAADDLDNAGLNRILAFGSPASTPSGGVGSAQSASIAAGGRSATHSTADGIAKMEAAKLAKENQKLVAEQINTQISHQNLMGAQSAKALAEARESEFRGDRLNVMNPVFEQAGSVTKSLGDFSGELIKDAADFWNSPAAVSKLGQDLVSSVTSGAKHAATLPFKSVSDTFNKIGNYYNQKNKPKRHSLFDVLKTTFFK